ncbi:MAG: hypothetical protein GYA24_12225 [Candidatus Lokiarchaeota archaeon]|nr:hypothetical protein [Candidatus Lokiarchaeota archaeon]
MRFENPIKVAQFEDIEGHEIPRVNEDEIASVCDALGARAVEYFAKEKNAFSKVIALNKRWLDPEFPFRKQALDVIPKVSGFSREMIETFGFYPFNWTFPSPPPSKPMPRLAPFEDGYMKSIGTEHVQIRQPRLLTRVMFGNVVGYDAITMLHGIASGVPQLIKVASGQPIFPFIYANSLEAVDPALRATIFLTYWKGGDARIEDRVFARSDVLDVWGANETIADVKRRVVPMKHDPVILENPHRVGMAFVSKAYRTQQVAALLALDIACWSGMACFCVKNVFVEGTVDQVRGFGKDLAKALDKYTRVYGTLIQPQTGTEMLKFKEGYEKLEYDGKEVTTISPARGLRWLVAVDGRPLNGLKVTTPLAPMCVIQPVDTLVDAISNVAGQPGIKPFLEEAAVAIPQEDLLPLSERLFDAGFMNIKTAGSVAFPKQWEPHGGAFYLTTASRFDGLRWVCIDTNDIDAELQRNRARLPPLD